MQDSTSQDSTSQDSTSTPGAGRRRPPPPLPAAQAGPHSVPSAVPEAVRRGALAPSTHHATRSLRASAAIAAGRASTMLLRRTGLGGGTTLPGLVARGLDPLLARRLAAQLRFGSVVITGTNGKTSTSGLTAYVLRALGLPVWRNREGSNLARGVTAALVQHAHLSGKLRDGGAAAFVFEVDEAAFSGVVAELSPRIVALLNLFRDQLDRYGEVNTVAERWRRALGALPSSTTVVLNADDPALAALADVRSPEHVLFFGVDEAPITADGAAGGAAGTPARREGTEVRDVIDARTCLRCHSPLTYDQRFYSHIGHWRCPACGWSRPIPQVHAQAIVLGGLDQTQFTLCTPQGEHPVTIALPGLYNVYNALAAAAAGVAAGAPPPRAAAGLGRFTPAFGRAEHILVDGRVVRILLAKNPTGFNEVLRLLAADGRRHHLLLVLNDQVADGEDVSWIWDADFEQVAHLGERITAAGRRAHDLALRLKYAGVVVDRIQPDIGAALSLAVQEVPPGETLDVLPTYTAMLAVRGALERRGYTPRYWEQEDA